MENRLVLESTESPEKGLIVLPGISSGPFGTPFDAVVDYAQKEDYSVVRVSGWEDAEDLEDLTLADLHQLIDEAIKMLTNQGCEFIGVIGKSFGGQLALTYPDNNRFEFMVLWAPAIGFGEDNVEKWRSTPLGQASTATDISLDEERAGKIDTRVKIIHGTDDEVVPYQNSADICETLPDCELSTIEGGDHSFTRSADRIVSETVALI